MEIMAMQRTATTVAGGDRGAPRLDGAPLHLILQHAFANAKPADIVNLLFTSKSLKAAVLDACKGRIHVQFTKAKQLDKVLAFTSWMAKYGQLASSMEFQTCLDQHGKVLGEDALAVALQQAALSSKLATATAKPGSLQLRTCTLFTATAGISAVLEQLPASCLSSLDLRICEHCLPDISYSADDSMNSFQRKSSNYLLPLSNSLSHLTSLRDLDLEFAAQLDDDAECLDPMVQQLSALTQLSRLKLSYVTHEAPFHALPASLKELTFAWENELAMIGNVCYPLLLGHLTALTRLEGEFNTGLADGSVLPGSLVVLNFGDICGGSYVRSLQNLQVLLLENVHGRLGGGLQNLAALSALSHVEILYEGNIGVGHPEGLIWQSLPLKRLYLGPNVGPIEHAAVQHLGKATQLTELTLWHPDFECSPADFAAALKNLKSLKKLTIGARSHGVRMFLQPPNLADGASMGTVFQALAGSSNLQKLHLQELIVGREAAQALAFGVANQLTALTLRRCGLDDCSLNVILLHCLMLIQLDVSSNAAVGDGVLPLTAQLPALKHLVHHSTGITEGGLAMFVPHML